jgi:NitT/TauT family transport system substrate-binding protein
LGGGDGDVMMRLGKALLTLAVGALVVMGAGQVQVAAAADMQKVTYALATADINVGYPYATLAKALGYFEEEGLDVDIVPGQSSAAITQLLLSGRADIGLMNPYAASAQRANNDVPLVAIYPISRQASTRIVVPADGSIKDIADLKGKIVAVTDLGSSDVAYLKSRLREAGLSENDVTIIATGYGTPTYEAFKSGRINAFITFNGGFARMKAAGYDGERLPLPEAEREFYSFSLYSTRDYVAQHGDVIEKLGRATAKATVFVATNPEAAVRIFWQQFPDRAPKDLNDEKAMAGELAIVGATVEDMKANSLPVDFAWGSQTVDVYTRIQDYLVGTGQITNPIDPQGFFTSDFEKGYADFDHAAIVQQAKTWPN